jgi:hypothetical protein
VNKAEARCILSNGANASDSKVEELLDRAQLKLGRVVREKVPGGTMCVKVSQGALFALEYTAWVEHP